ncbi:hypothetical protein ACTACU_01180 [Pseudomonas syringae]|uniref:hypothetical protein n=1 Tax=Pseudomonas syringae TaxID=317 RepID=UPI000B2A6632
MAVAAFKISKNPPSGGFFRYWLKNRIESTSALRRRKAEFFELCLNGDLLKDEIDCFVEDTKGVKTQEWGCTSVSG